MVSCSDSHLQNAADPTVLPIEDVTVHPLGDEFTVAYTAKHPWKILLSGVESNWLTASVVKGDIGTTSITFKVNPNIVDGDRSCNISFCNSNSNKVLDSFCVSQEMVVLSTDVSSHNFGWQKSSDNGSLLSITSNIEWALTLNDDVNFSVDYDGQDQGGAVGNRNVKVKANNNNFATSTSHATIIINPVKRDNKGNVVSLGDAMKNQIRKVIDLSQDNLIFLVNDNHSEVELENFSELGEDYVQSGDVNAADHVTKQTLVVTTEVKDWNIDYKGIADRLNDWGIEITKLSETPSEYLTQTYGREIIETELEVTVRKPNPTRAERNGSFDFYLLAANGDKVARPIYLNQNPYIFDFTCNGSPAFENISGECTLEINTTGSWYIKEDEVPAWLKVSQFSGVGNASVKVTAENQNLNFDDIRFGLVIYSDLNDLTLTETISQNRFVFMVEGASQFDDFLSRLDVSDHIIYVTSSGPWTLELTSSAVDDGKDWLDVDVIKGEAGERIPVVIKASSSNPDKTKYRGKNIAITSNLHEDGGKWPDKGQCVFDVIQDMFRFEFSKNGEVVSGENFAAYDKNGVNTSVIRLRCSAPWRITEVPEWIKLSEYEGLGDVYPDIRFEVNNNTGYTYSQNRQAKIIVRSDPYENGSYSDIMEFTITQDKFVFNVNTSNSLYSVEPLNEIEYNVWVEVTEGATWTVSAEDWLGVSGQTTRTGSGLLSFKPKYNGKLETQSGSVKIVCDPLGVVSETNLYVVQEPYVFDNMPVTLSKFEEVNPSPATVSITCLGPWVVQDKPDWIYLSQTSGTGNTIIGVTAYPNPGPERNAIFYINSTVGGVDHTKMIVVSQNDLVWEMEPEQTSLTFDVLGSVTETVKIKSSSSWTATATESFVKLAPDRADGDRFLSSQVKISVEPNYTLSERKARVIINNDIIANKKHEISIVQPKYDFVVGGSDYNFEVDGGSTEIPYSSTGKLTVNCSESWLTCTVSNDKVTFTAQANKTDAVRTAKVIITTEHYSSVNTELYKEITFTQKAK